MSDDLAAKAANWVPPWQRPADSASGSGAEADADAGPEAGSEAGSEAGTEAVADAGGVEAVADTGDVAVEERAGRGLPGQWDKLAGAKWQTVRQDALPDAAGVASQDAESRDAESRDAEAEDGAPDARATEPLEDEQSWGSGVAVGGSSDAEVGAEQSLDSGASVEGSAADLGAAAAEAVDGPSWDDGIADVESADLESVDLESVDTEAEDTEGGDTEAGVAESADEARLDGFLDAEVEDRESGDGLFSEPGGGVIARASRGRVFVPAQRVDVEDRPAVTEAELVPALEAILMVVDEPVGEITLAQVLDVPAEQVANALIDLSARYTREGKGFDLRRAAGGWRFYTRAEYSSYVERFVLDGQQLRLTQASLETLAVVAYKQPVTRSRISAIRGVNCDGVVRTLIARGMIEECGTEPESGAHLYRTTTLFLEKLGLDSVEQLPPLAPFLPENLDEVALNE